MLTLIQDITDNIDLSPIAEWEESQDYWTKYLVVDKLAVAELGVQSSEKVMLYWYNRSIKDGKLSCQPVVITWETADPNMLSSLRGCLRKLLDMEN